jgi:two-component system alkaline phosphatase synthesis response regulator PhoP
LKILLAEDDPNISTISKMTLEALGGHEVHTVDNGEDAFNKAMEDTFDVILLDEMMPKMNGIKVCKELRARKVKTPIIFLSAKSQLTDVEIFEAIGTGFIPKPFDPMTLNAKILKILEDTDSL